MSIAIAVIKQSARNKKLKQQFLDYGSKKLLITETAVEHYSEDTKQISRNNDDLQQKAFITMLMKKTGVQKLPMEVWISEEGELKGKYLKY